MMNRLGVPLPSYHAVTAGKRPRATRLGGGREKLEERHKKNKQIFLFTSTSKPVSHQTHLSGTKMIYHPYYSLCPGYLCSTMLIYLHFIHTPHTQSGCMPEI